MTLRPLHALLVLAVGVLLVAIITSVGSAAGSWEWLKNHFFSLPIAVLAVAATAVVVIGIIRLWSNPTQITGDVVTYIGIVALVLLGVLWSLTYASPLIASLRAWDIPMPKANWLALGLGKDAGDVFATELGLWLWFWWAVIIVLSAGMLAAFIGKYKLAGIPMALVFIGLIVSGVYLFNRSAPGVATTRAIENAFTCSKTGNCPQYDLLVYAGEHSGPIPHYDQECLWVDEVGRNGHTTGAYVMYYVVNKRGPGEWQRSHPGSFTYMRVHLDGVPGSYKLYQIKRQHGDCSPKVKSSN